jgi:16S rRNA (cytidine1402-2'-O)-methyltransferase
LLELLGIDRAQGVPALWRFDEHRERGQVDALVEEVAKGRRVVLVSDAGTPTVADPGFRLVRACRRAGLPVEALPGPVAAVVALSGSGLPTDRFFFEGFLPSRSVERRERLKAMSAFAVTLVLYESPHRVLEALGDIEEVFGRDHEICVSRELTKLHEEVIVGGVGQVRATLSEAEPRGEFVICVAPVEREAEDEWAAVDRAIDVLAEQGLTGRTIKEVITALFEVPRSELYDRIRDRQN